MLFSDPRVLSRSGSLAVGAHGRAPPFHFAAKPLSMGKIAVGASSLNADGGELSAVYDATARTSSATSLETIVSITASARNQISSLVSGTIG